MDKLSDYREFSCRQCIESVDLGFDFTMAFQPIVHCSSKQIFGYEALVRGLQNESAFSIISRVNDNNRYRFDQLCRIKAIALAAKLNITTMVSINFLPNAVYRPERCIRTTLEAANEYNFPISQIMFEFTEVEKVKDNQHIKHIVEYYKNLGFGNETTPVMDEYYKKAISLPIYPNLTHEEQNYVCEKILEILK